jgi:hypothetical protein
MNFLGESGEFFPNPYPGNVNIEGQLTIGAPPNQYAFPASDAGALVGQVLQYEGIVDGVGQIDFVTSTGPLDNTLTSPDTLTTFTVGNAQTTLVKSGQTRFNVDATQDQLLSPNGTSQLNVQNLSVVGSVAGNVQLSLTTTTSAIRSPDSLTSMEVIDGEATIGVDSSTVFDSDSSTGITTIEDPTGVSTALLGVIPSIPSNGFKVTCATFPQFVVTPPLVAMSNAAQTNLIIVDDTQPAVVMSSNNVAIMVGMTNMNTSIFVDDVADVVGMQVDNNTLIFGNSTTALLRSPDTNSSITAMNTDIYMQSDGTASLGGQVNASTEVIMSDPSDEIQILQDGNVVLGSNSSELILSDPSNVVQVYFTSTGMQTIVAGITQLGTTTTSSSLVSPDGNSSLVITNGQATLKSNGNIYVAGTVNGTTYFNIDDTIDTASIFVDGGPVLQTGAAIGGTFLADPSSAVQLNLVTSSGAIQGYVEGVLQIDADPTQTFIASPDTLSNVTVQNGMIGITSNGDFGVTAGPGATLQVGYVNQLTSGDGGTYVQCNNGYANLTSDTFCSVGVTNNTIEMNTGTVTGYANGNAELVLDSTSGSIGSPDFNTYFAGFNSGATIVSPSAFTTEINGNQQILVDTVHTNLASPDSLTNIYASNGLNAIYSNGVTAIQGATNAGTSIKLDDATNTITLTHSVSGMEVVIDSTGLKLNGVLWPTTAGIVGQRLTLTSPTVSVWA